MNGCGIDLPHPPLPFAHWGGLCTYSRSKLWSSKGTNPLWFRAGWMQCCCRALVCFAPTLAIQFYQRLAYTSFANQFFRCLLWGQFLCVIFYHTKVSLYSSPSGKIQKDLCFFHKIFVWWIKEKYIVNNVCSQCQIITDVSHRLRVLLSQGPQGSVFVH